MLDMAAHTKLKSAFLQHQCRVRQIIVRQHGGRPDASVMPEIIADKQNIGQIITVMNKLAEYSKLPEIRHIASHTNDPALRIEKALKLFSEYYYQYAEEFSDELTACFDPSSEVAKKLVKLGACTLKFSAYGQDFTLACKVRQLAEKDYSYRACWWHNHLFNPHLANSAVILAFQPNWRSSKAEPEVPMALPRQENWQED